MDVFSYSGPRRWSCIQESMDEVDKWCPIGSPFPRQPRLFPLPAPLPLVPFHSTNSSGDHDRRSQEEGLVSQGYETAERRSRVVGVRRSRSSRNPSSLSSESSTSSYLSERSDLVQLTAHPYPSMWGMPNPLIAFVELTSQTKGLTVQLPFRLEGFDGRTTYVCECRSRYCASEE